MSFHLGYCHAPYFGVVMTKREKADAKTRVEIYRAVVQTNGMAKSTYNQKGSRWYIFLHRNHTELLFRQCATRLSVAVLDIAFQVM